MLKEFKQFMLRGNVVDLAIGVVIGIAFGAIVNSLVSDLINPFLGIITGGVDFENMFFTLSGEEYTTLALAKESGAVTLNYGRFITAIIEFLIVGFSLFLIVKSINNMQSAPKPAPPARVCSFCFREIHDKATRCNHCCADLKT